ncbi:class I SAM-dependent methyltransferase [Brevundimonas variabilis]|uniref:Cyclopropane fatty-acyl-phospholipid synthase-like methyltransferase n=1 Tax=Brevundimonas variabilis TaxID=74312 RepID=A0A7W9CHC2_9CAUL|nr:class I SAM-dependent methyltransferase [Brevundimonas variabilis]MBB5745516.1 cyclopropane fatty-acyl-phospholipid synthase-like methyltransferase [Brevundimonas variabilis]
MRLTYHRIAYEALNVCNAVSIDTVLEAVRKTGLGPMRALDIGCGNGEVTIRLAEGPGLEVTAVEYDPAMADLARTRCEASPAGGRITVIEGPSGAVLAQNDPWDLIIALGTTDPVGDGTREPAAMMSGLRHHLRPGGWLLWGDLVWLTEPSPPLRQIIELSGTYTDHAGWQAAATRAGLQVFSAHLSSQDDWNTYGQTMDTAVRRWLIANPDHPDAAGIRQRADQISMMMDFGRGTLGFGLYLLRRNDGSGRLD